MSRPDAPTPRTDAAWDEEWRMKAAEPNSDPAHGMCDFAMQLERELDLAQTEIKGHMRTEDDLNRDIGIYQASIEKFAMQHQRKVMGLEARIAELEKDAARYRWLRECSPARSDRTIYVMHNLYTNGIFLRADYPSKDRLDAAIDAALKGRA